ncbi:MAG: sulfur carrier protein ThiS [Nitrospirae bacterium]|nr:sulfur carrier protein ThiS [Nitrospirota bacterium]
MQIIINGEKRTIDNNTTIAGLIEELNIDAQRVAVELNMRIIDKADYSKTILKDNDSLEIVSFIGGGEIG